MASAGEGGGGGDAGAGTGTAAGHKRDREPATIEELQVELAASKARLARNLEAEAKAKQAAEAAEMRAAAAQREAAANESIVALATETLVSTLLSFAEGLDYDLRAKTLPGVAPPQYKTRCCSALQALCGEDGMAPADLDAAMQAIDDAGLAGQALELARIPPNERLPMVTGSADIPTVHRPMNAYLSAVAGALLPDMWWSPEAVLATGVGVRSAYHWFESLADGALLPHPERRANVVTTQLSAACYTGDKALKGVTRGRQHAAIRLLHYLKVRHLEVHPRPAALPAGPMATYSLVMEGFNLYVVCVEVAYEGMLPRAVFSQHGPLPLWGKGLMDYAARCPGATEPAAASLCYDRNAPGLIALVKLLRAGRAVRGERAFVVPASLAFSIPLPPPREWAHWGSGGGVEVYDTVDAGGRSVAVKVARQSGGAACLTLGADVKVYGALGAHGTCAAIPVLLDAVMAPDDKGAVAYVLGTDATVTNNDMLMAGDRVVTALAVVWSVIVALHHAHGARVIHGASDLCGGFTTGKAGFRLPSTSDVAAAIDAAAAAADDGKVMAALRFLPPTAQLVNWAGATVHAAATPDAEFQRAVETDVRLLHSRLLPSMLRHELTMLYDKLCNSPDLVKTHAMALKRASSADEAALPLLHLLHLALIVTAGGKTTGAAPAAAASGGGSGSGGAGSGSA